MTKIVETVTADTLAELRALRDGVTDGDLVELRLDGVRDVDMAGALSGRSRPVIVTCRPRWEGGRFEGSEEGRLKLLTDAARLGAEFVDVEWRAELGGRPFLDCVQRRGLRASEEVLGRRPETRLIVSHHDFEGVPTDLADQVRDMRKAGAEIVKVAVTARSLRDCVTLRDALGGEDGHV